MYSPRRRLYSSPTQTCTLPGRAGLGLKKGAAGLILTTTCSNEVFETSIKTTTMANSFTRYFLMIRHLGWYDLPYPEKFNVPVQRN